MDDHLNTLRSTNWELLNYFRSAYVTATGIEVRII